MIINDIYIALISQLRNGAANALKQLRIQYNYVLMFPVRVRWVAECRST